MQVASTIEARVWQSRNWSSTLPKQTVRVTEAQSPWTAAGGGDGRVSADLGRLEGWASVASQATVAGNPKLDRHYPFAEQAVRQVPGDIGLGLAGDEVPTGRLDGQAEGPPQAPDVGPFQRGHRPAEGLERLELRRQAGPVAVGRRAPVVGQLGDDPPGVLLPGTLLEQEAKAGKLLLEDPGTLDVVSQDGPGRPVDEQCDGRPIRRQVLAHVAAGGEPGDRVGPGEEHRLVAERLEEG